MHATHNAPSKYNLDDKEGGGLHKDGRHPIRYHQWWIIASFPLHLGYNYDHPANIILPFGRWSHHLYPSLEINLGRTDDGRKLIVVHSLFFSNERWSHVHFQTKPPFWAFSPMDAYYPLYIRHTTTRAYANIILELATHFSRFHTEVKWICKYVFRALFIAKKRRELLIGPCYIWRRLSRVAQK